MRKDYFEISHMQGDKKLFETVLENLGSYASFLEGFKYCLGEEIYNQIDISVMHHENYTADRKFDMIFIDGDHSFKEVIRDISKYLNSETLIVGDDFHT